MMKKLCLVIGAVMLAGVTNGVESTNRLHFAVAGFSIAPLEAPPGESPQQVLMMFLPAKAGFAANVSVQIQPYGGSIDDYSELSLKQFNSAKLKVLAHKKEGELVLFEYTGMMEQRQLHWYARAEKKGSSIYLVTATAIDSEWDDVETKLKPCVDSFRADGK